MKKIHEEKERRYKKTQNQRLSEFSSPRPCTKTDFIERSNLSVSKLGRLFVNGTLRGAMLPFSLLASHRKSMEPQLRGRDARGDHLIELKHPLESICKAA